MENEIMKYIAELFLKNPKFLHGFIAGAFLMLIFRKVVIKFIAEKILRIKFDKKKEK